MEKSQNYVELWGTVDAAPYFSHENHGKRFYCFPLSVERLSGQRDILRVLLPEMFLSETVIAPGKPIRVTGQLRSFNNKSGKGSRLIISVYAQQIVPGDDEQFNRILLEGVLCKPPVLRRTPLGRNICDFVLAVNRHYGRADYLPCIAWGQIANIASTYAVGQRLLLEGRVQSRTYTKQLEDGCEERTAYEVSVMQLLEEESALRR